MGRGSVATISIIYILRVDKKMILSGTLVSPVGEPLANTKLSLRANKNSVSVLKFSTQEFSTDENGAYEIDVPYGEYSVSVYDKSSRGMREIGHIVVRYDTSLTSLSELLMVEQTSSPRDPILDHIESFVAEVQDAASSVNSSMQELDQRVQTAITEALDGFTPRDGVDGVTPVLEIGTVVSGETSSATITGTTENPILNLTLQRGEKGDKGEIGLQGPQGIPGSGVEKKTNVLTKCLFGRYNTHNPNANWTTNIVMELESEFTSLRIGIPNISGSAVNNVKVCVGVLQAAVPQAWLVDIQPTGGWVDATFNGSSSVNLPNPYGAERASFAMTDTLPIKSIARTDGGIRPLIIMRFEYPQGSLPSIPYLGTSNWRQATTPRVMKTSVQNVLGVTDKASYTQTTNTEGAVLVPLVQYFTKKKGKQLFISTDSTGEGVGSTPNAYGAVQIAAYTQSTPDAPIEYFNAGLHAQGPATYSQRLKDVGSIVKPTMVFYSPYSVNDASVGGLTDAQLGRVYTNLAVVMDEIRNHPNATLVLLEPLPNNPAFRDTGAGDQRRRDLIAELSTYDILVAQGYAAALSGSNDSDGQTLIKDGLSNDNVHPNITGYTALAEILKPIVMDN